MAAYARVSTDSDEKFTSFDSQCKVYEDYIKSKPDWEFVKVYADDGLVLDTDKMQFEDNQLENMKLNYPIMLMLLIIKLLLIMNLLKN